VWGRVGSAGFQPASSPACGGVGEWGECTGARRTYLGTGVPILLLGRER